MLFDLLRINESIGFAKSLNGIHWCCSELTLSNVKSINNINCSQDGQPGHSFLGWKLFSLISWRHFLQSSILSWQPWKRLLVLMLF